MLTTHKSEVEPTTARWPSKTYYNSFTVRNLYNFHVHYILDLILFIITHNDAARYKIRSYTSMIG